jgi:3D (Asp-Asp-Asp) domain-containing protein
MLVRNALLALTFATIALLGGGCGIRPPKGVKPTEETIVVTGYCDCGKCCGWERSWLRLGMPVYSSGAQKGQRKRVGITATGSETRHGTAAVDRTRYPYGTVFYVPGYGYARGEDCGSAIKNAHIDLWFPSHEAALQWGRKTLKVKVWRPKSK